MYSLADAERGECWTSVDVYCYQEELITITVCLTLYSLILTRVPSPHRLFWKASAAKLKSETDCTAQRKPDFFKLGKLGDYDKFIANVCRTTEYLVFFTSLCCQYQVFHDIFSHFLLWRNGSGCGLTWWCTRIRRQPGTPPDPGRCTPSSGACSTSSPSPWRPPAGTWSDTSSQSSPRTPAHIRSPVQCGLKGQCHEIFDFRFFL